MMITPAAAAIGTEWRKSGFSGRIKRVHQETSCSMRVQAAVEIHRDFRRFPILQSLPYGPAGRPQIRGRRAGFHMPSICARASAFSLPAA
jgi:hypothetical protein